MSKIAKNIRNSRIFIFSLITSIVLFACAEFGAFENQGLDAKTEKQVLRDIVSYKNKMEKIIIYTIYNISIYEYYGIYKGYITVTIAYKNEYKMTFVDDSKRYCFSGIKMEEHPAHPFYIVNSGKIYSIEEAWNKKILTYDNMLGIAEKKYGIDNIWCDIELCWDCK